MTVREANTTVVPMLDLSFQNVELLGEMRAAFERLVTTGQFILGPAVESFERALAESCGVGHAIGMSSGTDALLAGLMALGIGPGDEVITSPFTFFATAGSIARVGARPVFVDIDPVTFNIDPMRIESAVTGRTKAIMPVHLFGLMAEMGAVMEIARRRGLHVIEDAAQSLGAEDGGEIAGGVGDVGCLSFYPTKNLSALGDAGACVTNDGELAGRIREARVHGQRSRYHHAWIGGNFRLDAVQAAMLEIKLRRLGAWQRERVEAAEYYLEKLSGLPVRLPESPAGKKHVYHQFTVRITGGRRDGLRDHLQSRRIQTEVYYPLPLHLQECFAYLGYGAGDFPESERVAEEVLSLPIFPGITRTQQDWVIESIREYFQ